MHLAIFRYAIIKEMFAMNYYNSSRLGFLKKT